MSWPGAGGQYEAFVSARGNLLEHASAVQVRPAAALGAPRHLNVALGVRLIGTSLESRTDAVELLTVWQQHGSLVRTLCEAGRSCRSCPPRCVRMGEHDRVVMRQSYLPAAGTSAVPANGASNPRQVKMLCAPWTVRPHAHTGRPRR